MYEIESHFFENKLQSWFSKTCISNFPEIQKLILEFLFSFKTSKKLSLVNKEGLSFYRSVQKATLGCIKELNTLEHQTWMNSNPDLWLSWLLMSRNNSKEDDTSTLIPLDPRIVMRILFNFRKLHPVSYKTRIIKDTNGEPFLNVELSAISLGNLENDLEDPKKPFSSIYDMFSSKRMVFGVDLVYGQRIYQFDSERDSGSGEIIISVQPEHIFDVLSHKEFSEHLYSTLLGIERKFCLGDWSGYFSNNTGKEMYGKFMKSILLPLKTCEKTCRRPTFPFVSILATSHLCKGREAGQGSENIKSSLYESSIDLLEEMSHQVLDDSSCSRMVENAILYKSPSLAFFLSSSCLTESTFQLIIDSVSQKEKSFFLGKNLEPLEELYETNQLDLVWENFDENSPLFKNSYKSKHRPPWRTSIDNIINAMQEKQSQIISHQPSIAFNHQTLRNDAGYISRVNRPSFGHSNENSSTERNFEHDDNDEDRTYLDEGNSFDISPSSEQNHVESPSLVASGFVMGVRCLPASTAITSLGSIIGNGNPGRSGSINRVRGTNLLGNQSQRLSIPRSDITGRLSSCPTFSSIATSWGTPVPITRTIPIDDILGRRRESIHSTLDPEKNDQNELILSEIRVRYNLDSDEDEVQNEKNLINGKDKDEESENFKDKQKLDIYHLEEKSNSELEQALIEEEVLGSLTSMQIKDSDASILAKETLKSWKYVNYDFDEELEMESEEYENEE
ncbi:unnamed protein product [Cryptosporidium hominis]|uniref:Uncharacterized protein n=2 Tax=Cryptosporidium hominis TaxID=237895 RepID=A0A0S4THU3_CRYHO|nr:hypothetical protein ChTU502y2012_379g0040 [Cryptosporidium hominis]PPA63499.1 hypothetical protein ChUKH1_08160 [Cryptosporidium hominis]CUV06703.1 unnamed protein product [Cryptosporidium hominis]